MPTASAPPGPPPWPKSRRRCISLEKSSCRWNYKSGFYRHLTDGTVESQFEPLFPVPEEERFCFLDLSLFGAKTQFVPDAVLGAHKLPVRSIFQPERCFQRVYAPMQGQGVDGQLVQLGRQIPAQAIEGWVKRTIPRYPVPLPTK